jgi:hypothetical protein
MELHSILLPSGTFEENHFVMRPQVSMAALLITLTGKAEYYLLPLFRKKAGYFYPSDARTGTRD